MKVDLLYPELSYKIVGCAFEVFNEIGGGHKEITFHNAMALAIKSANIPFKDEIYFPVKFRQETVGKNYFDFLVEDKIVVEIKSSDRFVKSHFDQLVNYLVVSNLKLGILIAFGRTEVKFKRILNVELLNKEKEIINSQNS
jgi:GxxExxY protein